ncbi:MAG: cupin domain-containing protein [Cyanobacteria bacterium J06638_6]
MKIIGLDQVAEASVSHNRAIKKRVLLGSHDLPHLTNFSQARFSPGDIAPGHSHGDMAEVFFIESGQGTIFLNGQPYPLGPGTCIAVEPNEHHEIANTGHQDLVVTYFGLRV